MEFAAELEAMGEGAEIYIKYTFPVISWAENKDLLANKMFICQTYLLGRNTKTHS